MFGRHQKLEIKLLTPVQFHRPFSWLVCCVDRCQFVMFVNIVYGGDKLMRQLIGVSEVDGCEKETIPDQQHPVAVSIGQPFQLMVSMVSEFVQSSM